MTTEIAEQLAAALAMRQAAERRVTVLREALTRARMGEAEGVTRAWIAAQGETV